MNRFFPVKITEIVKIIEAEYNGDDLLVSGINRIEFASNNEITFFKDKRLEKYLKKLKNVFLIVSMNFTEEIDISVKLLRVEDPYLAFIKLIKFIDSKKELPKSGIHPTAIIGENCVIDNTAYIGPGCIIGDDCKIGANTILHSNVILYDNVEIGSNNIIHSSVVFYNDVKVENYCIIHSGAVIGSDGFGFIELSNGAYEKIPQIGNVVIKNNVEIGANTTIDRALVGSTIIENGVKIDNLCQIAHNVVVGENSAMAAQVGISGSTIIGRRNRFGGQVGLAGHMETVDDVIILAQSGVAKSVEEKGIYFGSPIKDKLKAFKIEAAINNLPETVKIIEKIRRKLEL